VDIFIYEYRGYDGNSNDKPKDTFIIEDIMNAYNFLINEMNYKASQIILYGQSLGSGPSVYLASNINSPVGGLILHSPLAGGAMLINSKQKV